MLTRKVAISDFDLNNPVLQKKLRAKTLKSADAQPNEHPTVSGLTLL
jgi:hypothetical protein